MKWLILLMLLPFCAFAQKPDYIRTPNGPNTIVDWNVKFKTLIVPHGGLLTLAGSQDSTGHLYLLVTPSDTSLYFYVRGKGWLLNRTSVTGASVIAALGYTPLASEVDPLVPNYAKSLTAFSVIKSSTDILYQPIGSYLTTEVDPTVPSYSKSLSAFSAIKSSTDPLYQAIGSYYTQSQVNALLAGKQATLATGTTAQYLRGDLSLATFPTAVSAFTNDAGYLTGAHVASFNTRTGAVVPLTGDYSAFYYPISGNPSAFLTSESDPTVPSYSKSLTTFSVVKTNTDALYYPIPVGLTTQYVRGDGSLATSPTTISSFTNDAGYLTNTTGDSRYPQLSGGYVNPAWIISLPYSKITGTPAFATLSNGYGVNNLSYNTGSSASIVIDTSAIKSKASSLADYNVLKAAIPAFANPSGTIGLTANNGSATTAMRSDGTPALSQAIIPSWTGLHTFSKGITTNGNYSLAAWGLNGANVAVMPSTYTDSSTPASTTVANMMVNAIGTPTIAASNTAVTYTLGSTLYISNAPTAGSNVTITSPFALYVNNGSVNFNGNTIAVGGLNAGGSNFIVAPTTVTNPTTNATLLFGGATTVSYKVTTAAPTSPTIPANNNYSNIIVNSSPITTAATGTHKFFASEVIKALGTVTAGGGALTNTTNLYLDGQSTAGTNNYTLFSYSPGVATTNAWFKYGKVRVSGLQVDSTATAQTSSAGSNNTGIATNAYVDRPLLDNQLLKTASYTIVAGDFAVDHNTTLDLHVDATAGAVVITMPSATTMKGYTIYITRDDAIVANTITINTVLGGNLLTTQYQSRSFKTDPAGISWYNH